MTKKDKIPYTLRAGKKTYTSLNASKYIGRNSDCLRIWRYLANTRGDKRYASIPYFKEDGKRTLYYYGDHLDHYLKNNIQGKRRNKQNKQTK